MNVTKLTGNLFEVAEHISGRPEITPEEVHVVLPHIINKLANLEKRLEEASGVLVGHLPRPDGLHREKKLRWTVFASGGPVDNPWNEEKSVYADSFEEAITESGFGMRDIDGVIREDILSECDWRLTEPTKT